jgi:uncharacterized protein (TIGR03437 family)
MFRKRMLLLLLLCALSAGESAAVTLGNYMMLREPPADCDVAAQNPPTPVSTFLTTDVQAVLWFYVIGAKAGDVAESQYFSPGGQFYSPASGAWPALPSDGSYCYPDLPLKIAGAAPASMPGLWTVRVLYNGTLFFTLTFTIAPPSSNSLSVPSSSNIFAAGRTSTSPMDGTLPPTFSFSAGPGKVLTFQSVTGTVQCGPSPTWSSNGPDGLAYASDINSYNNISGLVHPRKSMFLTGVFLAGSLPAAAPARLNFTNDSFTTLSPAIGQTFFIGDGLTGTGTGTQQQFLVPPEATRLFLGYADASFFRGNPGSYFDNSGSLTATFNVSTGGACSYTLNAAGAQAPAAASAGTVVVSTVAGCPWTATSNAAWVTITSGASGSGGGTVSYSVTANTGTAARTGTLTIAGQTFTVTQSAANPSCSYAITPNSASAPAGLSSGTVSVTTTSGCSWAATSNASWITITAGSSGTGSGTVAYSVAPNVGTVPRTGTLTIAGRTFTVTQAGAPAAAAPLISAGGVVNAADYSVNLSPGILFSIFGTDLAPATRLAAAVPLPRSLDGVSVEVIDGSQIVSAPLVFVSQGQINAQMPFQIQSASVGVRVRNAAGLSNTMTVPMSTRAPRLLTASQDGKGQAVAVHLDYSLVTASAPGAPGEILVLFLTGLGAVNPAISEGAPGGDGGSLGPLNHVTESVEVLVGGVPAIVHFAGLAPGFPGLYQINFEVPQNAPAGLVTFVVTMDSQQSQAGVTLASSRGAMEPVAIAAVGPAGGDIEGAGFRLTVPAGAFSESQQLDLSRATKCGLTEATRVSPMYGVSGLPGVISQLLVVEIDVSNQVLPQDGTYIVMEAAGGGQIWLKASVAGSRARVTLPSAGQTAASPSSRATSSDRSSLAARAATDEEKVMAIFWVLAGITSKASGSGRFEILRETGVPSGLAAEVEDKLDLAYHKMGTIYSPGQVLTDPANPMMVYLGHYGGKLKEPWGEMLYSPEGHRVEQHSRLKVDVDYETTFPNTGTTLWQDLGFKASHLLFHALLGDPRNHDLWFEEAAATLFEHELGGRDYYPGQMYENAGFLLRRGLNATGIASESEARRHGYGAALFLRTLSVSPSEILRLYSMEVHAEQVLYGPDEPIPPLVYIAARGNADLRQAWLNFTGTRISPPGAVPAKLLALAKENSAEFTSVSSRKTEVYLSQDLSAWIGQINIRFQPAAGTKFIAEVTGNSDTYFFVYTLEGESPVKKFGPQKRIEVASEALFSSGQSLLILVSDARAREPFNGSTLTTLDVHLESGPGLMEDLRQAKQLVASFSADFYCAVDIGMDCDRFSGLKISSYQPPYLVPPLAPLTWLGLTRVTSSGTASFVSGSYTYDFTVSLDAHFSDDGKTLLKGVFSRRTEARSPWKYVETLEYTLTDVPYTRIFFEVDGTRKYVYQVIGVAGKTHLTGLKGSSTELDGRLRVVLGGVSWNSYTSITFTLDTGLHTP